MTYLYSAICAALRINVGFVVASCGAYSLSVPKSPVSATTLVNRLSWSNWLSPLEAFAGSR